MCVSVIGTASTVAPYLSNVSFTSPTDALEDAGTIHSFVKLPATLGFACPSRRVHVRRLFKLGSVVCLFKRFSGRFVSEFSGLSGVIGPSQKE